MSLELFCAVQQAQHDKLRKLLRDTNDIDYSCHDQTGDSILILAVKVLNNTAVKLLLQHGVPPDLTSCQTLTALQHAVKLNNIEIVELLLAKGAKAHQSSGCIILEAVSNENEAMVTLLCAHGAKTTGCLSRAVELNSHLMVNVLLKKGVDPNELTSDRSPLMLAASKGYGDIALLLLNSNAIANTADIRDHTAMHYAASFQTQIILYSIHPSIRTILPTEKDFGLILRKLHSYGVDVNAVNEYGCTALHLAAMFGHATLIKILVELGANIDAKDKNGCTALMATVGAEDKCQLKKHASCPLAVNILKRTITPTTTDFVNVANQLLASGTDVNTQDNYGNTALMYAIHRHNSDDYPYLTLLANAGADPLIRSMDNKTASEVAAHCGRSAGAIGMLVALENACAAKAGVEDGGNKAKSKRKADDTAAPVDAKKEGGRPRRSTAGASSSCSCPCSTSQAGSGSSSITAAAPILTASAGSSSPYLPSIPMRTAARSYASVAAAGVTGADILVASLAVAPILSAASIAADPTVAVGPDAPHPIPPATHPAPSPTTLIAKPVNSTWLAGCLAEYNMSPALVQLCEEKLVRQEGFFTPQLLAATDPATEFHTAYLRSLGITALGLQKALLGVHATLRQSMPPQQVPAGL